MEKILKECPNCSSKKINSGIELRDGCYYQIIKCSKCGYSNNKYIGNAERR